MLNVGDEVMMIKDELHADNPEWYPIKGSIGVVVRYSPDDETALVDWGQDSGVDLNEHDEYAWVNFDDLLDYPLADWFKSFITHEQALENNDRDKNDTAEKMKPIIKTLKKSIDNVQKKI